jgi:hypothetical protein
MTGPARSDGPSAPPPEALAAGCAALAAFASGPYDDAGIADAATLITGTVAYLDTAARTGGLTSVTTVTTVTTYLAMTAGQLPPLLARAGDWLTAEITAGRVTAARPLPGLAGLAREASEVAAACACSLDHALATSRELTKALLGPEPDFAGDVPYDDLNTIQAASLTLEAAGYLTAAVQGGGITNPATLTGLTAGLATAAYRLAPLLAWAGDWLGIEITVGRVIGGRPLPELSAAARGGLEAAAAHAAQLARALEAAHTLTAALRLAGSGP